MQNRDTHMLLLQCFALSMKHLTLHKLNQFMRTGKMPVDSEEDTHTFIFDEVKKRLENKK